jgi:hypothetical protein
VSLEGSLETISLPDVLALLSVTAKTGELRVEAGSTAGAIWFDAGRLSGFDAKGQRTAADALFYLLRLREGEFKFHTGTTPANPVSPQDVAPMLEEAERWLAEWPAIEAVIPSMSNVVRLQDNVTSPVTLHPDQWQMIATIGWGRPVEEVLAARGLGEFEGCQAVKRLVDLGLVEVVSVGAVRSNGNTPPAHTLAAAAAQVADPGADRGAGPGGAEWQEIDDVADLSEIWDDAEGRVATDGEKPEAEPEPVPTPEPVNRGLLLKFLGSARN